MVVLIRCMTRKQSQLEFHIESASRRNDGPIAYCPCETFREPCDFEWLAPLLMLRARALLRRRHCMQTQSRTCLLICALVLQQHGSIMNSAWKGTGKSPAAVMDG